MKVITKKIIRAIDGKLFLEMGFDPFHIDTNLPYKKTKDHWLFYANAIKRILKESNS